MEIKPLIELLEIMAEGCKGTYQALIVGQAREKLTSLESTLLKYIILTSVVEQRSKRIREIINLIKNRKTPHTKEDAIWGTVVYQLECLLTPVPSTCPECGGERFLGMRHSLDCPVAKQIEKDTPSPRKEG